MSDMDTSEVRRRRKRWPESLKREIVAATYLSGASVSVVARQYDVNANQVFSWRRRYREADQHSASPSPPSTSTLLPVTIASEPEDDQVAPIAPCAGTALETIEIEISDGCRVRVGSRFDGRALKRVLDVLRKQ